MCNSLCANYNSVTQNMSLTSKKDGRWHQIQLFMERVRLSPTHPTSNSVRKTENRDKELKTLTEWVFQLFFTGEGVPWSLVPYPSLPGLGVPQSGLNSNKGYPPDRIGYPQPPPPSRKKGYAAGSVPCDFFDVLPLILWSFPIVLWTSSLSHSLSLGLGRP